MDFERLVEADEREDDEGVPVVPSARRRRGLRDLSLVTKAILTANLLLVIATCATAWFTYDVSRRALRDQIIASGKDLVVNFAEMNTLEFLDDQQGPLNLKLRLDKLMASDADHRIRSAYVLNRKLDFLVATADEKQLPLDPTKMSGLEVLDRQGSVSIGSPVTYEDTVLGYVVFDFDKGIMQRAARRMLENTGIAVLVALALNVLLLLALFRRLLGPARELEVAAAEFTRGNYRYRIGGILPHDEIGAAARSFNAMCDELELHMKFSNAALVDRIRRVHTIASGEEHQLTLVFGDACGYTNWSQYHSPRQIFATLIRYFTCVGWLTVEHFGGVIDKFMGDGVMAHFGLLRRESNPRTHGDVVLATRDALRATIYAQLVMRMLSFAIHYLQGEAPLAYRFGIASGRCLIGAVGARGVMLDFSVIGSVVNLASRLEGKAKPGGILVDRFTLLDVGEGFIDAVDCGQQQIKGVPQLIQTYGVRGFASVEELERMRHFLLERFLTEQFIHSVLLDGRGTAEQARTLRQYAQAELTNNPYLPV